MTTVLQITLPWGRYHATPWNRSANEGVVDWPPSPWRLLRALYYAWKVHAVDLDEADVVAVLNLLAAPPAYVLPPFTEAHTRHYLPGLKHAPGIEIDTAKTLDAVVVVDRDATVWVEWPVVLSDEQRSVLSELAAGVRYLGRAESIVDVRVVESAGEGARLELLPDGAARDSVQVLAPEEPLDLAALTATTTAVRSSRRLVPQATRWLEYPRPAATTRKLSRRKPASSEPAPTAARFELSGSVLPPRFEAVALGEMMRRACMSKHGGQSKMLSGKDEHGVFLRGPHDHAHYLSIAPSARSPRIRDLVVWAPGGFDADDVRAFELLREVWAPDYLSDGLRRDITLTAVGKVNEIAPEICRSAEVGGGTSLPGVVWESLTPYSPVRHHKGSLSEQLLADVNHELHVRGLPAAASLDVLGPWLRYRRYRPGKERLQRSRPAYGLRVVLEEPVGGPLALGQLSHFGLGLFKPIPE